MSIARIYQKISLKIGEKITLDEGASHHLSRVLRAHVDDLFTIFNGEGGEFSAQIIEINKKNIVAKIQIFTDKNVESPLNLTLAQGIARGEKMDFIVQKAVELGVKTIIPLITERCNVRLDREREAKRLQHWQAILIGACEQSGRNFIPEITAPKIFSEWILVAKAAQKFVLSPHFSASKNTENQQNEGSCIVLIGPEGGLSDGEVASAIQQGFDPLLLGPRVLRTETATIAALSYFQVRFGDFGLV